MHQSQSAIHSDKRPWLDRVHQQRKERSVSLGMATIDFLVKQEIPVTYHTIREHSKQVDPQGKGIHPNTIKRNDELYAYYQKHSHTYKVNQVRKNEVFEVVQRRVSESINSS